ncbi:MAG TPA: DUF979 domain-containing protein [Rudaea sp.]|nr:DUF979 domain-containing protein [Rudaea sp.]
MLRIEYVYWLCGALFFAAGTFDLGSRRYASAAFWMILSACFFGGDAIEAAAAAGNVLPAQFGGIAVVALALIAGSGVLKRRSTNDDDLPRRRASAERLGNRLFLPALAIPLITLLLILSLPNINAADFKLFDTRQTTLVVLGVACVLAAVAAMALTRATPLAAFREGSRLLDALSWAALLPMLLATLGAVFAKTGVGDAVAQIVSAAIPTQSRDACVLAYGLGMALFTIIMGNAFAAFPVITAGVGLPLLIGEHHAHAAVVGALGMLCGYCGTLLTPMAANFNIVPVALLELRDPNAVIRAQWPTAVVLFAINLLLLDWLAFR